MRNIQFLFIFIFLSVFAQSQNKVINEKLIPFENKRGKWGYLDSETNNIIIAAKYDFVSLFENGIAEVSTLNTDSKLNYGLDNSLKGYIDEKGNELFAPQFTGIYDVKNRQDSIFQNLKLVTLKNGTSGIISIPSGKWIVEAGKYADFQFYNSNQYLADNTVFVDGGKKYLAPKNCKITSVDFENHFFEIQKESDESKNGICTWEGKIITASKYLNVNYLQKTKTILASSIKGKISLKNLETVTLTNYLLDANGKQIRTFESQYYPKIKNDSVGSYQQKEKQYYFDLKTGKPINTDKIEIASENFVFQPEKNTYLFGLKDKNGKMLLQPIYNKLEIIKPNFIIASKNGLGTVINNQGIQLIPSKYRSLYYDSDNRLLANKNEKYGIIDFVGKTIIDFKYNYNFYFNDGFANVHSDTGEGIIDTNGNEILPTIYETVFALKDKNKNSYFTAEKDNKWAMFDNKGKQIIPFEYGYVREANDNEFDNGWVITEDLNRKQNGLINIKTGVTILPVYSSVRIFKEFLIASKSNENNYLYQLLNLKGTPISNEIYEEMDFVNGYLKVSKNNLHGLINTKGDIIIPLKYNYLWARTSNLVMVEQDSAYFYVNTNGKEFRANE